MRVFVAFSRQDGDSAGVIFCGTRRGEKDFSLCSRLLGDSSHSLGMTRAGAGYGKRFLTFVRNDIGAFGMTILKLRI